MKPSVIVQARLGSRRLPGKSAMLLEGKPLVWHVINRAKRAKKIKEVILAVPSEPNSGIFMEVADDLDIPLYIHCGPVNDLVGRYAAAATFFNVTDVVRVPADNPCVDPDEIDRIIEFYQTANLPWNTLASNLDRNINNNGYPGGLGAEVYNVRFIKWMNENLLTEEYREHPHKWAFHRLQVAIIPFPYATPRPEWRFDVNTIEDFNFIERIYKALYKKKGIFKTKDLIDYLTVEE